MNWLKHNVGFVSGVVVALGLLLGAIAYCWDGWSHNAAQTEELKQGHAQLQGLEHSKLEAASTSGLQVETLNLRCRGVDLSGIVTAANEQMAYELEAQLKQSPLLRDVTLDKQVKAETGTFTIGVSVKLKQPLELAAAR